MTQSANDNLFRQILDQMNGADESLLGVPQPVPDRKEAVALVKLTQRVILPQFYHYEDLSQQEALEELYARLQSQIRLALRVEEKDCSSCGNLAQGFVKQLPRIKAEVLTDIQAIYDGDPSAPSRQEVVACYPGFYATFIYRIAHTLFDLGVPFIPRIMSEFAHEKTGIDINPGAVIGQYFCIDHGTGVVIGQTARIGSHVRIYQGVTIGAKSFEIDDSGSLVKGGKRHPDIGDRVTIYANATLLGGHTRIGDDSVIGANVWLTHSVEPGSVITYLPSKKDNR